MPVMRKSTYCRALGAAVVCLLLAASTEDVLAQAANNPPQAAQGDGKARQPRKPAPAFKDDAAYQQSTKLLAAIDDLLTRAAEKRAKIDELPRRNTFIIPPLWKETREDRQKAVRRLLDAALGVVTDVPVVDMQEKLSEHRHTIASLRDQIASLRERRMRAPQGGFVPGVFTETQASIDSSIADLEARIKTSEEAMAGLKREIRAALEKAGVQISEPQLDLLLDSVLGGDIVKLVTAFQAARGIDERLGELLTQSNEDVKAARRYFAMHAALFAMIVHAQDALIEKIDNDYAAKLNVILDDIARTRSNSRRLLSEPNRPDQKRALEANMKAQDMSEKVASFYRDYLMTQRRQLAQARDRTLRDLEIADNTFDTVEASFQLHALMEDARTSFEALQKLEAPGFDQVFKNEALRKEFESLTQKLGPTS